MQIRRNLVGVHKKLFKSSFHSPSFFVSNHMFKINVSIRDRISIILASHSFEKAFAVRHNKSITIGIVGAPLHAVLIIGARVCHDIKIISEQTIPVFPLGEIVAYKAKGYQKNVVLVSVEYWNGFRMKQTKMYVCTLEEFILVDIWIHCCTKLN